MSEYKIPEAYKFTENHEWIKDMGDDHYRVGITDYAAKNMGDVTYVELPEVDDELEKGDSDCVVETVKSSEDIFNPVTGTVTEINEELEDAPETVNNDSYGEGWLYEIEAEEVDMSEYMDAAAYRKYIEEQDD